MPYVGGMTEGGTNTNQWVSEGEPQQYISPHLFSCLESDAAFSSTPNMVEPLIVDDFVSDLLAVTPSCFGEAICTVKHARKRKEKEDLENNERKERVLEAGGDVPQERDGKNLGPWALEKMMIDDTLATMDGKRFR